MTKLTLFNLSVMLETTNHNLLEHIKRFLKTYYTIRSQGFGQNTIEVSKVFVSKIKDQGVYYFHTRQFVHLYHYLEKIGVKIEVDERVDMRDYDVQVADYKIRDGWALRDNQKPINEFLLKNPVKSKLVPIQTGAGKAQPLDARIKIPGGWAFMRDMKIDTEIIAKDGSKTKVTGVYPQGMTSVYKITFRDGRSCEASDEHLWKIYLKDEKKEDKKYQIVNTLRLKELTNRKTLVAYIDLILPEISNDIELPIHPYLLGGLLGDGGFTTRSIKITKYDKEFIDKIRSLIPDDMELVTQDNIRWNIVNRIKGLNKSFLITQLKNLGLRGKYSHEKFIPDIYLSASHQQRLELLQGLMDTDGCVCKGGAIIYGTSSYFLANQVQYLIRSIGGMASISTAIPYYVKNNIKCQGRLAYRVKIRHTRPMELFTLTRKLNRLIGYTRRAENKKLRIETVEYIGEKETQCISIDHPDKLYITDHFIVTHNTFTSLHAISEINNRLGVILAPLFIPKWISDIANIHIAKTEDILVVQGSKSLRVLINLAKLNKLENRYYIFSTRTMQDYVSQYEDNPELCIDLYGCAPIELFPLLKIGIALVDESHIQFHAVFKILLHTNVKYQIGLSATMISDDDTVTRAHKIVYSDDETYQGSKIERYTDVYAINYSIAPDHMRFIKTKEYGSNNYSHNAYEKSVNKNKILRDNYVRLITSTIDDYYLADYEKDDKILIFVATVNFATHLTDLLVQRMPEFKVRRYCEDDPYENLMESDVIISTVISSGTAVDIPNLRVAIQTVCISSTPSNIQTLGRLRKLKDRDVKFCYLYSNKIQKHEAYHKKRVELFQNRVANIVYRQCRYSL